MKCIYKGWCCDRAEGDECVAAEDFACPDKVSDVEYQRLKAQRVDPALCENCGFKGTPLCTHPGGYYQEEPAGLSSLHD